VISPDGVDQAYDGETNANPYYNPGCNCWVYAHQFATWWGSASTFSQPNQTLGQQDYVDPAWIDNSHLLLSATGILIALTSATSARTTTSHSVSASLPTANHSPTTPLTESTNSPSPAGRTAPA
jgi:hypothetical protein